LIAGPADQESGAGWGVVECTRWNLVLLPAHFFDNHR